MSTTDGPTSNIWLIPTDGTATKALTDFGEGATSIARQASWSPDGKYVFAAVADINADVVVFDGLL